ncbi:MAG TPA: RNA polymerase sigma factor region1.1 domain-containing protein [Anaeromyxobacteraceae bacterium]
MRASQTHRARKELFRRGIQQGSLTVQEIERALPAAALTDAERWLLYYSLSASGVEIRDADGSVVAITDGPSSPSS